MLGDFKRVFGNLRIFRDFKGFKRLYGVLWDYRGFKEIFWDLKRI